MLLAQDERQLVDVLGVTEDKVDVCLSVEFLPELSAVRPQLQGGVQQPLQELLRRLGQPELGAEEGEADLGGEGECRRVFERALRCARGIPGAGKGQPAAVRNVCGAESTYQLVTHNDV